MSRCREVIPRRAEMTLEAADVSLWTQLSLSWATATQGDAAAKAFSRIYRRKNSLYVLYLSGPCLFEERNGIFSFNIHIVKLNIQMSVVLLIYTFIVLLASPPVLYMC